MKKFSAIVMRLVVVAVLVGIYVTWSVEQGRQADILACKAVTPEQAGAAIIEDVTRSGNKVFFKYSLKHTDVLVDSAGIQISQSTILVPFRIAIGPHVQYFGMPRCSKLTDVEYSHD
ncbi:hypothetical protein [Serratia ficaria]|uniref:hypothetical protein n=1 Tax=Serratia ficaria TaxID=61651 RepID=UPI0021C9CDC0|nr:hypothetical protein [Serratia ficaria]